VSWNDKKHKKNAKTEKRPFETLASVAIFWHFILDYELRPHLYIRGRGNVTAIFDFWYFFRYLSVVEISRLSRLWAQN
jgi:hypothetical protein